MSFMKRYTYGPQFGWRIETSYGTEWVPGNVAGVPGAYSAGQTVPDLDVHDLFRDYTEGEPESAV